MNTALKLLTAGLALMVAAPTAARASDERPDILIRFQGLFPSRDEDWDNAAGVEVQARFWGSDSIGFSLAAGAASWEAPGEYVEEWDGYGYYSSIIDGNVTAIPIGGSLWFRGDLSPSVALTFEAGLRYVFVNSQIDTSVYYDDGGSVFRADDRIDIDDAIVSVLGLYLDWEVSPALSLHTGLGYQFDLTKPEESVLGDSLGTTDFSGITLGLGFAVRF